MGVSVTTYALTSPMADEFRRLSTRYAVLETSTARTLTAADHGKTIFTTNASATAITVPAGLPSYFECDIVQKGAGQITVSAGSGVTVSSYSGWRKTAGQQAGLTLRNNGGTDTYWLGGQLTA